jgi:hypothetical protein
MLEGAIDLRFGLTGVLVISGIVLVASVLAIGATAGG